MKKLLFIALLIISINSYVCSQVITHGPEIENKEDRLLTKILDGDSTCFFTYRLKEDAKMYYLKVEKFDRVTMNIIYSTEIEFDENIASNVFSVGNKLYIFYKSFREGKMTVYFKEMSDIGKLMPQKGIVMEEETDRIDLSDYEIIQNADKTKFVVKAAYQNSKTGKFQLDFVVIDSKSFVKVNSKKMDESSFGYYFNEKDNFERCFKRTKFWGLCVDKNNTVYCAYSYFERDPLTKIRHNRNKIIICAANDDNLGLVDISFDHDCVVFNACIAPTSDDELVYTGFIQNIIKKSGPDEVKNGIFGFTIDVKSRKVTAHSLTYFDDNFLLALSTSADKAKFARYKADYTYVYGKKVFVVGEMYEFEHSLDPVGGPAWTTYHHYRDVVVAKYSLEGNFEWIKNLPLKTNVDKTVGDNFFFSTGPVPPQTNLKNTGQDPIMEYISFANQNKIYVLNNESPFNLKIYSNPKHRPESMLFYNNIVGSNLVFSSINMDDGSIEHKLLFQNKQFCFAPSPYIFYSEKTFILDTYHHVKVYHSSFEKEEPFLKCSDGVIIYTHQDGKDRFSKVKFD